MNFQKLSYKILFSILFFALAGIVFLLKIGGKTTKVSATWWDSSWHYRRSITITNTSGTNQTNTLIKVLENYDLSSLVSDGKLQSDLDDLRFTDNNDNLISHWTQDNTSTSADIWVILPSLPSAGTTIWMYYGNSSASSTSTSFFSYTGTSEFIDDSSGNFRIKFKSSGNFIPLASMSIDTFLVGGGGGGYSSTDLRARGGGGGGYTATYNDLSVSIGTTYAITVGSGGSAKSAGNSSSGFSYSASGGSGGAVLSGGAGGSGGGGSSGYNESYPYAGYGGSNGSNGGSGAGDSTAGSGGVGQGTTTREFGESTGDLYAGGGSGGVHYYGDWSWQRSGGDGGGGTGGFMGGGSAGTANTGGGGGGAGGGSGNSGGHGGSGIVVIRLNPVSTVSLSSSEENNFINLPSNCRVSESTNDSQLTILWGDTNDNEDNYLIQKSTNGGSWTDLYYAAQNSTSYTDNSISANNTYQYRISPYTSGSTNYTWCYTSTLDLGQGNFNFEGINFDDINID